MNYIFKTILIVCLLYNYSIIGNNNIFIIAPPKAGNHLIAKIIRLLTDKNPLHSEIAPTGLHWTHIDPKIIHQTNSDTYLCSHAFAIPSNISAIKDTHCKAIFVYRDPRDQLISLAHFMKEQDAWPSMKKMSLSQIIMKLIHDYSCLYIPDEEAGWGHPLMLNLKGINDFYHFYLKWINQSFVYTTTFEKLVGEKGGGNRKTQIQEILNIAHHIGIDITLNCAEDIADHLFGGTATFQRGLIGQWKDHFTNEHKYQFKKEAGQLLIDLEYETNLDW